MIRSIFRLVGPEKAYNQSLTILNSMLFDEKTLFASTIFDVFPYVCNEGWIYVQDKEALNVKAIQTNEGITLRLPNNSTNTRLMMYERGSVEDIRLELQCMEGL